MKKTIEEQSIIEYPVVMMPDHNYPTEHDTNANDRSCWIEGATWQKQQIQPVLDNYNNLIEKYKQQIADLKKQITEFKKTEDTYSVADYARLQGRINTLIHIVKELEEAQLIK
jgi:protease II